MAVEHCAASMSPWLTHRSVWQFSHFDTGTPSSYPSQVATNPLPHCSDSVETLQRLKYRAAKLYGKPVILENGNSTWCHCRLHKYFGVCAAMTSGRGVEGLKADFGKCKKGSNETQSFLSSEKATCDPDKIKFKRLHSVKKSVKKCGGGG